MSNSYLEKISRVVRRARMELSQIKGRLPTDAEILVYANTLIRPQFHYYEEISQDPEPDIVYIVAPMLIVQEIIRFTRDDPHVKKNDIGIRNIKATIRDILRSPIAQENDGVLVVRFWERCGALEELDRHTIGSFIRHKYKFYWRRAYHPENIVRIRRFIQEEENLANEYRKQERKEKSELFARKISELLG